MTDTTRAHTFAPDPNCVICDGLGVRHTKPRKVGDRVIRDKCPCTIIGPLKPNAVDVAIEKYLDAMGKPATIRRNAIEHEQPVGYATRPLSEIPPIGDSHLNRYEAAREREHTAHLCRTPIEPVSTIKGVIYKGNTDLPPSVRGHLSEYRDCTVCAGRGASMGVVCRGCDGYGKVRR